MKSLQKLSCLFIIPFFILSSCKNESKKINLDLANIDLKRGELLLCSSEQFGEVSFSLDCNYEVRETFDLAISLLHSFEYTEAEKAFVKVIDMDSDCAMAYWGIAMSIYHGLWAPPGSNELKKGIQLINIAESLPKSENAQLYIDAIGAFYKDWETKDHRTRQELYESKMEALYNNNREDTEAAVFYALAIRATADPNDKNYTRQKKSGKILEDLFVENPNHPGIAHYVIHNYDYPELAERALTTARRYAEIAPASAHAQHMPSHIFTRLGLWQESIDTNINSASSAVCYAEGVNPDGNWTAEIHAVDYLVYAYLQMGDNEMALEQLKEMQAVKDVFPKNDFASTYALSAIPVRYVLENKDWEKAANLELPAIDFPWDELHWEKAMMHFGKALGYSHLGDIKSAEDELKTLKSLHENLMNENDDYRSGQVMIQVQTAEAWINLAKGNKTEALSFMRNAAELESQTSKHPVTPGEVLPADELLGDLLMALNRPEEALTAYEVNLKGHPNRFNGVYGAAIAARESNDNEKATYFFNKLLELDENSKSERPEITEAKSFLQMIK